MEDWYKSTYNTLLIVAFILFIIAFGTTGNVNIGAIISAYSMLILSIMMILVLIVNQTLSSSDPNVTSLQSGLDALRSAGPLFIMLGVLGFVLYLIIYYKNSIIDGHVSSGYNTFSSVTTIFILLQLYIIYTSINSSKTGFNGKLSKIVSSCLLIIGLLSIISSLILYTILKYYTTDGFQ